jgi:hypothetical protein
VLVRLGERGLERIPFAGQDVPLGVDGERILFERFGTLAERGDLLMDEHLATLPPLRFGDRGLACLLHCRRPAISLACGLGFPCDRAVHPRQDRRRGVLNRHRRDGWRFRLPGGGRRRSSLLDDRGGLRDGRRALRGDVARLRRHRR